MDSLYIKIKNEAEENLTTIRRKKRKHEHNPEDWIPKTYCGYVQATLRREIYHFYPPNVKNCISLAMYDFNIPFLKSYANKLPILCINTYRLEYTIKAFQLSSIQNYSLSDALEFYLKYEIENIDMNLSQNLRFSKLLHSFKTTGSEKYIVALATYLEFSFDIIKNHGYVYRYNIIKASTNLGVPSFGVLTAVQNDSYWIVEASAQFITKLKN